MPLIRTEKNAKNIQHPRNKYSDINCKNNDPNLCHRLVTLFYILHKKYRLFDKFFP